MIVPRIYWCHIHTLGDYKNQPDIVKKYSPPLKIQRLHKLPRLERDMCHTEHIRIDGDSPKNLNWLCNGFSGQYFLTPVHKFKVIIINLSFLHNYSVILQSILGDVLALQYNHYQWHSLLASYTLVVRNTFVVIYISLYCSQLLRLGLWQ